MAKGVRFADAAIPAGLRVYAIGDVHGRLDLSDERMHVAIATELARDRPGDWRILHLGDYVDRGPDSRACSACSPKRPGSTRAGWRSPAITISAFSTS